MSRRNWKTYRPTSLQEAVEACVQYALDHKPQLSIERLSDLVGESKWVIYKWMEQGAIPARKIPGFEFACGRPFITEYLAAGAHKLVVDLPTGRLPCGHDIHALQESCTAAVGALLAYAKGKCGAEETADALTAAMVRLAHERAQVERQPQPELELP